MRGVWYSPGFRHFLGEITLWGELGVSNNLENGYRLISEINFLDWFLISPWIWSFVSKSDHKIIAINSTTKPKNLIPILSGLKLILQYLFENNSSETTAPQTL